MTNTELIRALRYCRLGKPCTGCPAAGRGKEVCSFDEVHAAAVAAIEHLTAETADLRKEIEWKDMVIALARREQAKAEAERDALREEQRWIPVTERMPNTIPCNAGTEYSEAVIVWTTGNKAMIAVWDGIDLICPIDFWETWGEEITHWMPLPGAPEDTQ